MDSTETTSIRLARGSEVVLDSMCTVSLVLCDVGGHEIIQNVTCWIMKDLYYDIILGIDRFKSTNLLIYWEVFSME